ncbi:pyruvate, water dikinase [Nocardiopsis sp. HNM0947]|uniref:Pyruvate, water dikinase n=1 Tax=Nocardiopsis coralli TaxID=2772213 RepID=A0ABR9P4Q9_9ACTN|nr:PEP/pyruvate-binding domain-containing protein [Nocardiopsis coralli]MBE2998817.1 pyruvate, water dikinase [Nocardiopsis coralli]
MSEYVVALDEITPGMRDLVGGKAAGLAEVLRAGENVPPGFCVTTGAHHAREVPEEAVAAAYDELGGGRVAVRSSATAEDLPDASFAGQQDTYLDVEGTEEIVRAIGRCWDSLWTERAVAYRRDFGIPDDSVRMAVVVQRMLEPRTAGVLFTADPVTGTRDTTVVDAVPGRGTGVVDGTVQPDHYVRAPDGGVTGPDDGCLTRSEVESLHGAGQRLQTAQNGPRDIEWALGPAGTRWILQSRAVTTLFPIPPRHGDETRVYFEGGHMQGMLRPFTPMGMSVLRTAVGSWATTLGIGGDTAEGVPSAVMDIGGRFYIDVTRLVRTRRIRESLPASMGLYGPRAGRAFERLLSDPRFSPLPLRIAPTTVARVAVRSFPRVAGLVRGAVASLVDPDGARRHLLQVGEEVRAETVRDPAEPEETRARLDRAEALQHRALAQLSRMLGPVYTGLAVAQLPRTVLAGIADEGEVEAVLRGMPHNVTTEMDLDLWRVSRRAADHSDLFLGYDAEELAAWYHEGRLPDIGLDGFLERYGQRSAAEIDVGVPRWAEDPTPVFGLLANYLRVTDTDEAPDRRFERAAHEAERTRTDLVARARRSSPWRGAVADFLFDRARRLGGVREYPKFVWLYAIAETRRELLRVGADLVERGRLERAEDIMFLDLAEAERSVLGEDLRGTVARRQAEYRRELRRRHVPPLLLSDGTDLEAALPPPEAEDGLLLGVPAAPGTATGRVRVIRDPLGATLDPGDVLVAPTTDPGWTPLFMTASALVVETGSTVAHGPTVAREYGIPAVISLRGATETLHDGQTVTVDGYAGTVRPHDQD